MAKTGQAVAKLQLKAKQHALRVRLGTFKPLLARSKSTFTEKKATFEQHKRMIHGHVIVRNGIELRLSEGGINPGPVFDGTGVPDELTIKPSKTNQERANDDKRNPLKVEWCDGFRPRPFGKKHRRSGCFLAK